MQKFELVRLKHIKMDGTIIFPWMESSMPTPAEILRFALSTVSHWGSLMTGGIIIAILIAYEHWKKKALSWRLYLWLMGACLFMAGFLAWKDEYNKNEGLTNEIAQWRVRSEEKDKQLLELRSSKAEISRRHAIREQLGKSIVEGRNLRAGVCSSPTPSCSSRSKKWTSDVKDYLRANLDSSYIDRFAGMEDDSVIPYVSIGWKMSMLADFIKELRD
jgi:hypothetical protein